MTNTLVTLADIEASRARIDELVKAYREQHKDDLCACGRITEGFFSCPLCRARIRDWKRKRRAELKAAGIRVTETTTLARSTIAESAKAKKA